MKITLDANPDNAPGCVLIEAEDGRSRLIQTDWDFPLVASVFGWDIKSIQVPPCPDRCEHEYTDGTVDCKKCCAKAGMFIAAAREWMDDNDGATAEDPGYFD